jgi:putative ABC transport system permease protein
MDAVANGLTTVMPYNKGMGARVQPVQEAFYQGLKEPLLVLQGAVAFVLMIACANVAALLLARAAARRSEMVVRASLGADRWRIVRQLLTESVILSTVGGLFGGLLAAGGLKLILAALPEGALNTSDVSVSLRVLGFTALVSILTGVVFGLVPALQSSKVDLAASLKEAGRTGMDGSGRQRVRAALVAVQFGLALVLLIGAGLMINSFLRIQGNDLGGDPKGLLTFEFRFPQSQLMKPVSTYRGVGLWEISPATALTFDRVYERVRGIPGVLSAAASSRAPFNGALGMQFKIEGRPAPDPGTSGGAMNAAYMALTPNYFATLRIPILEGRDFTTADTAAAPLVAIVNKAMVQRWWPNENPIGQRIRLDFVPDEQPREIVGVVGDTRLSQTQRTAGPMIYLPHVQQTKTWEGPFWDSRAMMVFTLRTPGNPLSLSNAVRAAVAEVDPSKPAGNIRTVEQSLSDQVSTRRVYAMLLSVFGVVAYAVTRRTREIGIRMALGASSGTVFRLVVRQALWLVLLGLVLGLAGSFVLTRYLANQLYGVTATDPATFVSVSLGLVLVAVLASLFPTRRAVTVDPTGSLAPCVSPRGRPVDQPQ